MVPFFGCFSKKVCRSNNNALASKGKQNGSDFFDSSPSTLNNSLEVGFMLEGERGGIGPVCSTSSPGMQRKRTWTNDPITVPDGASAARRSSTMLRARTICCTVSLEDSWLLGEHSAEAAPSR